MAKYAVHFGFLYGFIGGMALLGYLENLYFGVTFVNLVHFDAASCDTGFEKLLKLLILC